MGKAKIRLSQKETELINDASVILTKNAIMEKIKLLMIELQERQQDFFQHSHLFLDKHWENRSPKISKGENYKGLPYLILDYPRVFTSSDIFAVRTLCWWGNFFSTTLHLSGYYKKTFEEKIIASSSLLSKRGFFYCINDDQWEHDFEAGNYLPITEKHINDFEKTIREKSFIKLAVQLPLHQWDDATDILFNYFKQIVEMLDG